MAQIGKNDEKPGLGNLPIEILELVCQYLYSKDDFRSLRLISRKLNAVALSFVFHTIHVDLLPAALCQLASLRADPTLCQHVRMVRYYPLQLKRFDLVCDYKLFARECMTKTRFAKFLGVSTEFHCKVPLEKWIKCHEEHQRQYNQQKELLKDSNFTEYLTDVLLSFPKLETVGFAPRPNRPWYLVHGDSQQSQKGERQGRSLTHGLRLIINLETAYSNTKKVLYERPPKLK